MLFHLSTLALVIFLGAIVGTSTSRHEDDGGGLPALTDQANDHQQFVYDVDNGVNASFVCTEAQVSAFWNTSGVRTHLNRAPHEGCDGGHVVSRYITDLNPQNPRIRNVTISGFNRNTGLLTVSRYDYWTAGRWNTCSQLVKTLWNDALLPEGANLGQTLTNLGVTNVPANFPMQGWTTYLPIVLTNSEVERQCRRALLAYQGCPKQGAGSYVVPSIINSNNLCVRAAMNPENIWATCFPTQVNPATGGVGTGC